MVRSIISAAPSAKSVVRNFNVPIETLFSDNLYLPIRQRAIERIEGAIRGEISLASHGDEEEVLSYYVSRIYLSGLKNPRLVARWALHEAERAQTALKALGDAELKSMAAEFGLDLQIKLHEVNVGIDQYLSIPTLGPTWMLVNRQYAGGVVRLSLEETMRLLQAKIQAKICEGLPAELPANLIQLIQSDLDQLRSAAEKLATDYKPQHNAVASAFPPCISALIDAIREGRNLVHFARFALVTFLLGVNMTMEEIMAVFATSPDFNEERTRYQVEHIARGSGGRNYKTPHCSTFQIYNLCPGACGVDITNPLTYYNRKCGRCSSRLKGSTAAARAQ